MEGVEHVDPKGPLAGNSDSSPTREGLRPSGEERRRSVWWQDPSRGLEERKGDFSSIGRFTLFSDTAICQACVFHRLAGMAQGEHSSRMPTHMSGGVAGAGVSPTPARCFSVVPSWPLGRRWLQPAPG